MEESTTSRPRHAAVSSSQVSSVGFTTLKKLNTNSSASTASSVSSKNPLSRLFTKNRSSTALDEDTSDDERKGFSFKVGKRKFKNPKDLTIATDGTKESPPAPARKNTAASPVVTLHNFFHRSSTYTDFVAEDAQRTAISLSSSNSNSVVVDPSFAQVFKFTDPHYSLEEDVGDMEIHRKMFLPADQYLKARLPASPAPASSAKSTEGFSSDNHRFWTVLTSMTKPLFLPSQQKKLSNGARAPLLSTTEDDVAAYVDEAYLQRIAVKDDDANEYTAREVSSDLNNFFTRQLNVFSYDFDRYTKTTSDDPIAKEWMRISGKWTYFVRKILYFMLDCFNSFSDNGLMLRSRISVEALLLNSFKNIIVIPFLQLRSEYSLDSKKESDLLKHDSGLRSSLVHCFGMINTTHDYYDDNANDKLFIEAFDWLTKL